MGPVSYADRTDDDYRRPVTPAEWRARRKEYRKVSGKVLHAPVRLAEPDEVVDTRLSPDEVREGLDRVAEMRRRIAEVTDRRVSS